MRRLPLIPLLLWAPAPCGAQAGGNIPIVTDRPDFTESSSAVSPGVFQVEAGYTWARTAGVDAHTLGEVLLRIGVAPGAEVRVGLNSFVWSEGPSARGGMEDASLGVKLELASGGPPGFHPSRPALALLVRTTLPTGAEGFGEDALQPAATVAASWDLSGRLGLAANAGLGSPSVNGDRFTQLFGSVSLGASVGARVGAFGEYYVVSPPAPDTDGTGVLNGGLTVLVGRDVQLDMRAGWGVHGEDSEAFLGAGLATRF